MEDMMKKLSGVIFFIAFAITACGGGNSPSGVVRQLYTAIEKSDTNKINEVMTSEAAPIMVMFAEKAKGMIEEQGKIVKTEEKIDGDTATVNVTFEDGSTEEFSLIKIDGKWKITLEK
jgi:hypothetical protein